MSPAHADPDVLGDRWHALAVEPHLRADQAHELGRSLHRVAGAARWAGSDRLRRGPAGRYGGAAHRSRCGCAGQVPSAVTAALDGAGAGRLSRLIRPNRRIVRLLGCPDSGVHLGSGGRIRGGLTHRPHWTYRTHHDRMDVILPRIEHDLSRAGKDSPCLTHLVNQSHLPISTVEFGLHRGRGTMGEVIPILPYGGATHPNSGHAGSSTSQERAIREDSDGTTAGRQRTTLRWLGQVGRMGLTWKELSTLTDWHHGQSSGVLSVLHRTGVIHRLSETRQRCKVYVAVDHVDGRAVEPPVSTSTRAILDEAIGVLRLFVDDCNHGVLAEPGCRSCDAAEVIRHWQNIKR